MATPVSNTPREGEVLLDVERPPNSQTEVTLEMGDDSEGEEDVLLERPSHAKEREETSGHTSGEADNRSHVGPEPSSHAKRNEKADFVLVYKTWQENEDKEEIDRTEKRKEEIDRTEKRKKFDENLGEAGLDIIGTKDTEAPPVSSLSL